MIDAILLVIDKTAVIAPLIAALIAAAVVMILWKRSRTYDGHDTK